MTLAGQVDAVVSRAQAAVLASRGTGSPRRRLVLADEQLERVRRDVHRALATELPHADVVVLAGCLAALHRVQLAVHDELGARELRRRDATDDAVLGLRSAPGAEEVLAQACRELVLRCGLDRVMASEVRGGSWVPSATRARPGGRPARAFASWVGQHPTIDLAHGFPEADVVRTARSVLIRSTDARVHTLLRDVSVAGSYVVEPVVVQGSVVALLHADVRPDGPAGEADLRHDQAVLRSFAGGLSAVLDRAVLTRELRAHRAGAAPVPEVSTADAVDLTARERDVLRLIATGATNERIGQQLVITTGTVKSHVKRLLRKLGAANRAEATAWYLGGLVSGRVPDPGAPVRVGTTSR
ncbi:hypothetical protein F1C76_20230 [Geodermatophilaceae bacterium NBWT11]|nr:hypothetical protein F1C76_20230 [Geodermatophilaceae bacterium NBWT11]